ncbi:hypothetical protein [Capnocytophaga sp. G2]|jgi:hypothetical protein|uniref:hypothetical protein n=1 Tax=Capnocytophaga sp. G2 TaxID=3110695 RepID=UPI002B47A62B|nr:hypothetical protein [Capnocytophaga sp. G2]MEB3005066.1 hypothetical protein [Capnocytophaga sp. G2]
MDILFYLKAFLLSIPFLIGLYLIRRKYFFIPLALAMGFIFHIGYQILFYYAFRGKYEGLLWTYELFTSDFINIGMFLLFIFYMILKKS